MSLHLATVDVDAARWVRLLRTRGMADGDPGYLAHMWVEGAFGPRGLRPFHVEERPAVLRLLGYTDSSAEEIREHVDRFASPEVAEAGRWDTLRVKRMPDAWPTGLRVGFHARVCPTVRRSRSGDEVDVWTHAGRTPGSEEEVYAAWVGGAVGRQGVGVESVQVVGRRFVDMLRRAQAPEQRRARTVRLPDVHVEGILTVGDGAAFDAFLRRGIGRHRAFGFGMARLVPA